MLYVQAGAQNENELKRFAALITVLGADRNLLHDQIGEEHEENAGDEPEEEIPVCPALRAPASLLHLAAAHHDCLLQALCFFSVTADFCYPILL